MSCRTLYSYDKYDSKDDGGFNAVVKPNDKHVNGNVEIPNKVDSPPVNTFSDGDLTDKEMLDYMNKLARLAIKFKFTRKGSVWIGISKLFSFNKVDQEVVKDKFMIPKKLLDSCHTISAMDAYNEYGTKDDDESDVEDPVIMTTSINTTTSSGETWSTEFKRNQPDSNPQNINLSACGISISGDLPNNLTFTTSDSTIELTTLLTKNKDIVKKRSRMMAKLDLERSNLLSDITDFLNYNDFSAFSNYNDFSAFSGCSKNKSRRELLSTDLDKVELMDVKVIYQLKRDAQLLLVKIIHKSFIETSGHTKMALVDLIRNDKFLKNIREVRITENTSDCTELSIDITTKVADVDDSILRARR